MSYRNILYRLFKSLGSVRFFFFFTEIHALIKSDSKDIYNVKKGKLSIHQRFLKKVLVST